MKANKIWPVLFFWTCVVDHPELEAANNYALEKINVRQFSKFNESFGGKYRN
jgi:hypothetical protein